MATDAISGTSAASGAASTTKSTGGSLTGGNNVSKTEFLQLLVTQLKNQDPMDPMKNEEFAVQLAQFSQLEQLVSINDKIGGTSDSGGLSSMAAYLGNEVTLNTDTVHVAKGNGGLLKMDLAEDASDAKIELLDKEGKVVDTINTGPLSAGKQTVELKGLTAANGDYSFRVSATGASSGPFEPPTQVAGIVSGFVPGPDPTLMVNGMDIKPSDITSVTIPGK